MTAESIGIGVSEIQKKKEGMLLNQEGYKDPTAEKAIKESNRTPYHVRQVLSALRHVASTHGFEIDYIRDRKTGRKYD